MSTEIIEVEDILKKLGDLIEETGAVGGMIDVERFVTKHKTNKSQEMLDYLRVCIKYQAFDLEATRRENQYLRKLLEE